MELVKSYISYLTNVSDKNLSKDLAENLLREGLIAHSSAVLASTEGDCWLELNPYNLWGNCSCYIGALPPNDAPVGTLWFDIYDLSFMVKISNPAGYGQGVVGWLSISPVLTWQYLAFLNKASTDIHRKMFLNVDDLLSTRDFYANESELLTDIYHEEALCYAAWHGKSLASNIQIEAAIHYLTALQMKLVLPQGMYLWDSIVSNEANRKIYGSEDLSNRGKNDKSIYKSTTSEWSKQSFIGVLTFVKEKDGVWPESFYPMDAGEYLRINNRSRCL